MIRRTIMWNMFLAGVQWSVGNVVQWSPLTVTTDIEWHVPLSRMKRQFLTFESWCPHCDSLGWRQHQTQTGPVKTHWSRSETQSPSAWVRKLFSGVNNAWWRPLNSLDHTVRVASGSTGQVLEWRMHRSSCRQRHEERFRPKVTMSLVPRLSRYAECGSFYF